MRKTITKNYLQLASCLLCGLVFFNSCKKDSTGRISSQTISNDNQPLEISYSTFSALYQRIKNDGTSARTASPNSNFTSIKDVIDTSVYTSLMKEIIEDDALKGLINLDGEIIVDSVIYKITPYGTFFTIKNNRATLINIFNKIKNEYPITSDEDLNKSFDISNYIDKSIKSNGEYIPLIGKVYFISIFSKDVNSDNESSSSNIKDYFTNNNTQARAASINTVEYDDPIFNNLKEFRVGNESGNILHTFFVNDTKYNNFNKNYRTSVLLYNRNYGIIKSIGLKVKQQKKGWLWWNKTNAEQIVAGWSNVVYTSTKSIPTITSIINSNRTKIPAAIGIKTKNLFQILIPYDVSFERLDIASGEYKLTEKDLKSIALKGWNFLKGKLEKDSKTGQIPVYNITDNKVTGYTLAELESTPKGLIYYSKNLNNVGREVNLNFL